MKRVAPPLLAVAIVLLGAVLRFWALDTGLPHTMTRPDEDSVLGYVGDVALGRPVGWTAYPAPFVRAMYWWTQGGLDVGASLGWFDTDDFLTTYRQHRERLYLVARVLSASLGTLTVAVVIGLGRRIAGWSGGLTAGWLLAVNFLHARDSHFVKPDAHLALAILLALGAIGRLAERATTGRGVVAGVMIGLAMAVKHPAALLLLPAWVAAIAGSRATGWRRVVSAPAIGALAATVATVLVTWPQLLISPETRAAFFGIARLVFPQLPDAVGTMPPHALAPTPPDGAAGWRWYYGFVKHVTFSLPYGCGFVATGLFPVAVAWGLGSRRPQALVAAVFALVWFGVHGVALAYHARYMTPLVPVIALLEGTALAVASARWGGRRNAFVCAVLALAVGAEPLASTIAHDRIAARTDTRVLASEWIVAHVPPGSRIAMVGTVFWPWGEPQVPPAYGVVRVEPDAAVLDARHVGYVLVHDHVLFSSHVDPERMAALAPRLTLLQEWDPFVPGGRERAIFEAADAYYVPFHGFDAVTRPGPVVRLYAFR